MKAMIHAFLRWVFRRKIAEIEAADAKLEEYAKNPLPPMILEFP